MWRCRFRPRALQLVHHLGRNEARTDHYRPRWGGGIPAACVTTQICDAHAVGILGLGSRSDPAKQVFLQRCGPGHTSGIEQLCNVASNTWQQMTPGALQATIPGMPSSRVSGREHNSLRPLLEKTWKVGEELRVSFGSEIDPCEILERLRRRPIEAPVCPEITLELVRGYERILRELDSPVLDVEIPRPVDGKVVVVGDTHGQLLDVLHIFATQGPPSPSTVYCFVGDIVDRGPNAVEIWLLIIAFQLRYPGSVHVLRGNHEDPSMCQRTLAKGGGFKQECLTKHGPELFDAFLRVFRLLPLFAVVGGEVFLVHGGLPRSSSVDLAALRALPAAAWRADVTMPKKNSKEQPTSDEEVVFDALWGDPHNGVGAKRSRRSHIQNDFGEDMTHRFLDEAALSLCIRAHQAPKGDRGYMFAHSQRLLTVFSASQYGGHHQNKGSVALLREAKAGNWNPSTGEYEMNPSTTLKSLDLELVEHDIASDLDV